MITSTDKIDSLIEEIADTASGDMNLFIIGGGAMMYHGIKESTKDIDIVVRTEEEYRTLVEALSQLGFRTERPRPGMERVDVSDMMIRDEYRIDIFVKRICGKLSFSDGMAGRSSGLGERNGCSSQVCSIEDIFLLKSLTERDGDYRDNISILRKTEDFRWDIFIEEVKAQMGGVESIWITYVTDRLESINREGFRIPVMKEILRLNDGYMKEWADDFERRGCKSDRKDP